MYRYSALRSKLEGDAHWARSPQEREQHQQWLTILKELEVAEARVKDLEASHSYQYGAALQEHYGLLSPLPVNIMSEQELMEHLSASDERGRKPIVGVCRRAAAEAGAWMLYP